ncbi:hypothetical protein KR038_005666 [Drosophila bunnanda]|nr:hypothetical protein KR038_005666 [Drosophila bunnanda]
MGTTKERREQSEGDAATAAAAAATHTTTTAIETTKTESGAATVATTTTAAATASQEKSTNAAKRIRRAFSLPRNPFRWSRKFKTSTATGEMGDESGTTGSRKDDAERRGSHAAISSCVGGGRGRSGSIVSLSSYEAPTTVSANANINANNNNNNNNNSGSNANTTANNNNNNNNKRTRVLRRSSFRKFLNRIAQHLSSTVNVVSEEHNSPANRIAFIDIVPFYTGCWRRKEANKHGQGSAANGGAAGAPGGGERVPPIGGYQWPADQTPGVMGLKNHGNTCFMNAVLQCLSHTDILAEYFVLDQYKADLKRRNKINSRKFGTKGELTEQLANVLKALWTCKNESDHSTSFKAVVDRYGTQFRSSTQHDAQEFLFWLLDKVHEDLNTASKRRYKSLKVGTIPSWIPRSRLTHSLPCSAQNSYGRSDEVIAAETLANHIRCNNSFVQAVFQAQFRSSLTCPRCEKQSNTFDPFHCISVQLPQLTQQTIFVTVVYMKQVPRQVRMGLRVPAGSPIVALREQLHADTGIDGGRMVLVDLNAEGFTRVFYDTQPVETLASIETIYCIEVPEATPVPKSSNVTETSDKAAPAAAVAPAPAAAQSQADLLLLVANVYRAKDGKDITRFGAPFSMKAPRDCSYQDLQKRMLREMAPLLKPEVFSYATPLAEMFRIRLQDPSADPDTYLEQVEHPLLTEMIDMALSVLSSEAGPQHIKLLLEWNSPEEHFLSKQQDVEEAVVDHESVARLSASKPSDTASLTLEQCLEHYTKAETLSAEDAWRCPHCQQYLPVVKTLGLWSLPDILVVHFKRFRQHQAKGPQAAKLTTMVKFPLTAFDMSPHLARGVHESASSSLGIGAGLGLGLGSNPWKRGRSGDSRSSTLNSRCDPKDTRYDLYAVCYHQGDTLETGHYTAACKNPYDRQWYKFDDTRVSKVAEDAIEQDIINNEAYMLFYQRRSVDAGECSGSSSNSGDHWVSRIAPAPSSSASSTSSKEKEPMKLEGTSEATETSTAAVADKAQSKPVDIPKICKERDEGKRTIDEPTTAAQEKPLEVTHELNIEEIAFADADVDSSLSETSKTEAVPVAAAAKDELQAMVVEEVTPIFAMDEDCADLVEEEEEKKEETEPKEANVSEAPAESELTAEAKTNGHVSSSSSSSSSQSSLSSRSSPRSLSTSVTAASTLQNKFNGHMSTPSAMFNGNGNTPQLSSSLQLSRQVLQNHNWQGSRSSVSAVENATHHQQQLSLRHSFSTSSNYTETLSSLLRKTANTCSKDTLLLIDQQGHRHPAGLIEDDDDSYMGRSLWISPVTPHKLITVSPKN